eukprot:5939807-Alexandrium_andersonii.AAC.1
MVREPPQPMAGRMRPTLGVRGSGGSSKGQRQAREGPSQLEGLPGGQRQGLRQEGQGQGQAAV